MNIYIVRHGETAFNTGEQRFRGQVEIPLSDHGLRQADAVGKELSNVTFDVIYYSRISRAKQTAEGIRRQQDNTRFEEEPLLIDISWGDWEGKTAKEALVTDESIELWKNNPYELIPPNGETFYQALDRIHRLFKRLQTQPEKNVCLVTHGAIINLIFCYLYHSHPSHFWEYYVNTCSYSMVKYRPDGSFRLGVINYDRHITELAQET